ncbi:hypothetical protein QAD02_005841 [Eretmocerus hayati]|uniref:Uncharacterized protein n=1 Tax=Eretmocerus hayati TaxID=131215 RepID=A0ACC2NU05_9HYME|nr:hypothetical protein QAD02_005841 [Eretmocerus hayati]
MDKCSESKDLRLYTTVSPTQKIIFSSVEQPLLDWPSHRRQCLSPFYFAVPAASPMISKYPSRLAAPLKKSRYSSQRDPLLSHLGITGCPFARGNSSRYVHSPPLLLRYGPSRDIQSSRESAQHDSSFNESRKVLANASLS